MNSPQSEIQSNESTEEVITASMLRNPKPVVSIETSAEKSFMEKYKSVQSERAIVKSNDFNKRNHVSLRKTSSNQWLSPLSPDSMNKSFNHKKDIFNANKDSLWTSAQSSPNSTQHEQSRNQFKKSSSTPANLWESPNMKFSQATLMVNNNSTHSVWYTPPQIQSPAISSGQNIWDSPSSSIVNNSMESFSSESAAFLRPQDLSPGDIWYNCNKLQSSNSYNAFKPNASIWSTSSPVGTKVESNIFSSIPLKTTTLDSQKSCNKKMMKQVPIATEQNTNPASSSCLQLFSDDFMNYLNMIN